MKKLTPNLLVHDVAKSIQFYCDILGFSVIMTVPEAGNPVWALLKNGDVEIMLQEQASAVKDVPLFEQMPIGASMMLYIDVEDIDTLFAQVKSKAPIVRDMHTTFYGTREFAITDDSGYVLVFAQGA